jgi:putative serine protease PepD
MLDSDNHRGDEPLPEKSPLSEDITSQPTGPLPKKQTRSTDGQPWPDAVNGPEPALSLPEIPVLYSPGQMPPRMNEPVDSPAPALSAESRGDRTEPVPSRSEFRTGGMPPPSPAPRKKGRSGFLVAPLIGALLCLLMGGLVGWQIGRHQGAGPDGRDTTTYRNGGMPREQVIAQGRQAVVQINVQTKQGTSLGSGVIVNRQGDIVTNDHVVANGTRYQVVLFDGSVQSAQLVGTDAPDDLAVVKITPPKRLYAMPIGDSSQLEVGDDVLVIGNPLGITQTVTSGIVSALGRTIPEGQSSAVIIDAVQTDAAINPGNSGGALVNMQGQLIGIPTLVAVDPEFKTPANGVGFAIPSNRVKFIAPQLIETGKVSHSGRPAIGATVTTVDSLISAQAGLSVDHGALVVTVQANGPGERAGLKAGDVIVQVNNTAIDNQNDLTDALVAYNPGDTVTIGFVRGTQSQQQVKLQLGELRVS